MDANHSAPYAQLAVRFAEALLGEDFATAHALLSPGLRQELSADALRAEFEEMLDYGAGIATRDIEWGPP
ncbi:hypothetical protein CAI21_15930 [Alkalilimnicola ehrlichii]|uniref:Uncharacterized protein n=1 Tax=Alkalilimnicola ehrlichii TaxID=351052 RepID=A0A3E0WQ68_9GAMM|nr:hypothetical protein [Alkalilimnicola ehrlichii]RFA27036.1 hypothetical protein CAI21_15930 [Alkalilimnicola ehrlichii]RFA34157.1 hypothetical protein CAL65_16055 [Alkalilimnicola ehrlichii]